MSGDVGKGEFSERLRNALRVELDGAVERLLERTFWTSSSPSSDAATIGRGGAGALVISLHGPRQASGR